MDHSLSLQPLLRFTTVVALLASTSLWLLCYGVPAVADRSSATFMKGYHKEGGRRMMLRDISPPGMWPPGDDDEEYVRNRRRSLLSDLGDISPPGMWSSSDDENKYFSLRRRPLLSDSADHNDEDLPNSRRALLTDLRDISPPGMWPSSDNDDEYVPLRRRNLLSDPADEDDEYVSMSRRALLTDLRDISPPGMWPSSDDDDEYVPLRRRNLLSDPADEDDESVSMSRRALLTDLRDISPPGMWTTSDDDDEHVYLRRRALLSEFPEGSLILPRDHDTSPSASPPGLNVEDCLTPAPNSDIVVVVVEGDNRMQNTGFRKLLLRSLSLPTLRRAQDADGRAQLNGEIGQGFLRHLFRNLQGLATMLVQYIDIESSAEMAHSTNSQPQGALSHITSEAGPTSKVPSRRPLLGQPSILSHTRIEPKSHGPKRLGLPDILSEDSFTFG